MTLYRDAGGFDPILALCERWHARCLANPDAAHPFEHPMHPEHDVRLAAYLAEALGGPRLYSAGYGDESHMQRLHAGNGPAPTLTAACLDEFDRALVDVAIPTTATEAISAYFRAATAAMHAYDDDVALVPPQLPFNYAGTAG